MAQRILHGRFKVLPWPQSGILDCGFVVSSVRRLPAIFPSPSVVMPTLSVESHHGREEDAAVMMAIFCKSMNRHHAEFDG